MRYAALLLFLICSPVYAQIEVKSESATAIVGLKDPSVIGDLIVFSDGEIKTKTVGIIYV